MKKSAKILTGAALMAALMAGSAVAEPIACVYGPPPVGYTRQGDFHQLSKEDMIELGPVKKGASITFTKGELPYYYLFLYENYQWVAYKIPDGAINITVPVDSPSAIIAGVNNTVRGICTANKVNIRTEPDGNRSIGQINKGDEMTVLEEEGEWTKINCESGEGWIKTQYIKVISEINEIECKPL